MCHMCHANLIRRATKLGILLYIKPPICTTSKIRVVGPSNSIAGAESIEVTDIKSKISDAIIADRQAFMVALIDHYRRELASEPASRESLPGRATAGCGGAEEGDELNVEIGPAQAFAIAIQRQGQGLRFARRRTISDEDDAEAVLSGASDLERIGGNPYAR